MAYNAKPVLLYDNLLEDGTLVATDTAAGYDVDNLKDRRTFTRWKAASSGTKEIEITLGSTKTADAVAIVGHNLNTVGATVTVQRFVSGWVDMFTPETPSSDKAYLKLFTSASDTAWRIQIVSPSGVPEIGVILLGDRLTFERWLSGSFDPTPEAMNVETAESKAGHLLGVTSRNNPIQVSAQFQRLTDSWVRNTFDPAWDEHLKLGKPFAWGWDKTNNAGDVYYLRMADGSVKAAPYDPVRRSLTLNMKGITGS